MLKMFHEGNTAGGSVAFWEDTWRSGDYEVSRRFCAVDPLRALLDRYTPPGSVMLEGGCGRGAYVAYHTERGVRVVGLDFATDTLADVRRHYPSLLLGAADVTRLPLRDASVDTYYSGGVVEHFESGPHAAIAEARRVLRPDGVLLISVPYLSPLRRALTPFHRRDWHPARVHSVDPPAPPQVFFQYAYTPAEFAKILAERGFAVVGRQGYSILWGLSELPFVAVALRWAQCRRHPAGATHAGGARTGSGLKRRVVTEDDAAGLAGWVVRVLRPLAANMMMYVCLPTGDSAL